MRARLLLRGRGRGEHTRPVLCDWMDGGGRRCGGTEVRASSIGTQEDGCAHASSFGDKEEEYARDPSSGTEEGAQHAIAALPKYRTPHL